MERKALATVRVSWWEGPVLGNWEVSGCQVLHITSSRILGNALGKALFQHIVWIHPSIVYSFSNNLLSVRDWASKFQMQIRWSTALRGHLLWRGTVKQNKTKSWGLRSSQKSMCEACSSTFVTLGEMVEPFGGSWILESWLPIFFLHPVKHELSLLFYHMVLTMMCCQTTGPKQWHLATVVGNCYGYCPLLTWGLQSLGCGPLRVPVWNYLAWVHWGRKTSTL